MTVSGTVFQIQRFSLDDGPGIRTTVFLKGCPLRCRWCHNPESLSPHPQLCFRESKCTNCRACANACPNGVHTFFGEHHQVDFPKCTHCGQCVERCTSGALELIGRTYTWEQVLGEVVKDQAYYRESGGGVTFSGGEATFQQDFLRELLCESKRRGLHVCLDTCGLAPWSFFSEIMENVDLFLYDYKLWDPVLHEQLTGASNEHISKNLTRLHDAGAQIILRCPIIPGINDNAAHFSAIRRLRERLPRLKQVQVMPYHSIGVGKWQEIGLDYSLKELPSATEEDRLCWQNCVE